MQRYYIVNVGELQQGIPLAAHLKVFLVGTIAETAAFVLNLMPGITEKAVQLQGIVLLHVVALHVLRPAAAGHAGIGAVINFAEGLLLHIKRIAGKLKLIQRVLHQLLLPRHRILPPLPLQVSLAGRLYGRVGGAGSK